MFAELGKNKLYVFALIALLVLAGAFFLYKRSATAGSEEAFDPAAVAESAGHSKRTLIFFRANWCGHCTRFKPVWDETCAEIDKRPHLADVERVELDVDTEEAKPLMQKHNVRGFPHVVLVYGGDKEEVYSGTRTKEDLIDFLERAR